MVSSLPTFQNENEMTNQLNHKIKTHFLFKSPITGTLIKEKVGFLLLLLKFISFTQAMLRLSKLVQNWLL